ncbi:MAG: ribosomal-processing cysteine protease Prp [Clostridia bacterium]|nr:ribosomal-processing cysteine protease Prp [Clostridia bacterium]
MITADFVSESGRLCGFRISGHSGYAGAGSDIVCAAVSAMVRLTVNTVSELFGTESHTEADENTAEISFSFKPGDERAELLIQGLKDELTALAREYPKNIRVTAH